MIYARTALSSPGTGLSLWAGVVRVVDDDEEDDKEGDDMMSIAVCLSSYSLFRVDLSSSSNDNGALNKNGALRLVLVEAQIERERERDSRESP